MYFADSFIAQALKEFFNLQKNYTEFSGGYQLKLPLNIETIIPELLFRGKLVTKEPMV